MSSKRPTPPPEETPEQRERRRSLTSPPPPPVSDDISHSQRSQAETAARITELEHRVSLLWERLPKLTELFEQMRDYVIRKETQGESE